MGTKLVVEVAVLLDFGEVLLFLLGCAGADRSGYSMLDRMNCISQSGPSRGRALSAKSRTLAISTLPGP